MLAAICFFTLQVLYPTTAVFLWVILPIPPQESRPPLLLPILSFPLALGFGQPSVLNIVAPLWSFEKRTHVCWIMSSIYLSMRLSFACGYLLICIEIKPKTVITSQTSLSVCFVLSQFTVLLFLSNDDDGVVVFPLCSSRNMVAFFESSQREKPSLPT